MRLLPLFHSRHELCLLAPLAFGLTCTAAGNCGLIANERQSEMQAQTVSRLHVESSFYVLRKQVFKSNTSHMEG